MMLTCDRCDRRSPSAKEGDIDMLPLSPPKTGICGGIFRSKELNLDYVTVLACTNPQRGIVAVMHLRKDQDSYVMGKVSEALSLRGANALAESWAAALKLEVR
jgi:hypothetical protein